MADATGSFAVVKTINTAFEAMLKTFVHASDIFVAGISMIVIPAVISWFIYRCYKIMSGQVADPMLPLIQDFTVKMVILTFAGATTGSAALYQDSVVNTLRDTPVAMVKVITKEDNIYDFFEKKYNDIAEFEEHANDDNWFWEVGNDVNNALKMFALWIGFIILMLITTVLMIIEKTFFMLGLGFGIIFITFLAFESTRSYFNSWLSSVLGYGLSYVVTMYVIAEFLTQMGEMIKINGHIEPTWGDIGIIVFLCFFFSVIISRIGDLVSGWFGTGNITDGTALTGVGAAAFSKNKFLAVRGGAKSLVESVKNRGQDKMNRYNTRHTYMKNRKEAAADKDKDKNQNTAIKQGGSSAAIMPSQNKNNSNKPNNGSTSNNKGNNGNNSNTPKSQNNPQGTAKGNTSSSANNANSAKGSTGFSGNQNMKGSSGFSGGGGGFSSANNANQRPKNTASHPPKYDKATRSFKR